MVWIQGQGRGGNGFARFGGRWAGANLVDGQSHAEAGLSAAVWMLQYNSR